jgi:hypothetical protein
MKKHQQLIQCGANVCATIPEKAIDALHISSKRYVAWDKTPHEIVGTLCASETVVTTQIRLGENKRLAAEVLHAYVVKYHLKSTKDGGPIAVFEWDEKTLQVRIALQ